MVMMLTADSVNAGQFSYGIDSGFSLHKLSEYIPISSQMLTTKAKSILSNPVSNEFFFFFHLKVFSERETRWQHR